MNQTVYKSRVGPELLVLILISLAAVGALMAWQRVWVGLALIVLTAVFVLYVLTSFRYIIADGQLEIRGLFYKKRVDIAAIRSLRETRNPLSAPAASLDRLEIRYGKWDYVIISPKEKWKFMEQLKTLNPEIVVVETRREKS